MGPGLEQKAGSPVVPVSLSPSLPLWLLLLCLPRRLAGLGGGPVLLSVSARVTNRVSYVRKRRSMVRAGATA